MDITLIFFLFLSIYLTSGYADDEDWYKIYEEKIKTLEERIDRLETELQKYEPDTTQTENVLYEQLKDEIDNLASEIAILRTTLESQRSEASRIRLWGETKLRLRNVASKQLKPIGSYGEALDRGFLRYRLLLNIEAKITDLFSVGGKLRLSNEGKEAFVTGPEHFSNELGSAFVRYNTERIRTTFGCYDVYFTPLTLMRWDLEDNPEGGGMGGCAACPGAGGAITSESLEELAPDLIFEGVKLNTTVGEHVDLVALFARPHIAEEDPFNPQYNTYRQYTYGVRTRALFYHRPSMSFRSFGITYVLNKDDKSSATSFLLPPVYSPIRNGILSLDFEFPINQKFALRGEYALTQTEDLETSDVNPGYAMLGGIEIKYPTRMTTKIAYLKMSPQYKSLYNALSYASNREGFRISSNYEIYKNKLSIWVFYKGLREIESPITSIKIKQSNSLGTFSMLSIGMLIFPMKDVSIRSSYIYNMNRSLAEEIDNKTKVITTGLTYDITRKNSLSIRYRRIIYRDKIQPPLNSSANVISTLFATQF